MITQQPGRLPTPGQRRMIDRRYGMFVHFGVNTFGNVQWSDGGIPVRAYRPDALDTDQWARTAWEAGMNTLIFTAKHHDGFCLWDTQTTQYSVLNSGCPADVVKRVADSCAKYGVKLGVYYSLWDRNAPQYREAFSEEYVPYMIRQLTELLDGRYGDVAELWLDGAWDKTRSQWRLDLVYDLVKRLQPDCQVGVNHTVGEDDGVAGFPVERYLPNRCLEGDPLRMFPSDFRLWDPHPCRADDPKLYVFQNHTYYLPFEMTICSRDGFSWFYSNFYEEEPLLSVDETAARCRTAFEAENAVVINLPPDVHGRLVEADCRHLMEISRKLGVARV